MIIKNTYNSAIIYADEIDSGSQGLITALCGNIISKNSKIRIMPDVHAGKGCAVGTTMTITDRVAPGLVGVDIGCGVLAIKLQTKRMELQKLDKLIYAKIPSGRNIRKDCHRFSERTDLTELRCFKHIIHDKALHSIGTLGGGNHFIELDRANDSDKSYWLIVHSGSRHLGVEVASYYHNLAFSQCPKGTPYELAYAMGGLMDDYLHDMEIVQCFAEWNRYAIAFDIINGMKLKADEIFSTVHNYIDLDNMILRKGAVSANLGEKLVIPMNMRDGCLICVGKGNPDWNYSAPHGAGRLLSRKDAKESFTVSQYKKEMKGVYTTSVNKDTLDESPMAYKPMDEIVNKIGDTVDIIDRIYPVYNFKSSGD